MKNNIKLLSLLLLLIMLVQSTVVSSFAVSPVEIDTGILQATGTQPSTYSTEYNSGTRDVVATTLNGTSADDYYNGSYEYDVLSEKSASEIQSALASLMRSTHSYTSSYDDCHYKANRTDCENGNGSSNKLSLIYTSYTATMSQWNGWNREHVWPKSLGGDTTTGGGADLHHIRPSDQGVNSSRGNKKYGESNGGTAKYGSDPATGCIGGYYNSTYFEPLDNVKGDVARICLYVYVRWGSDWGATSITKVFQSVDVLLEWCELDPVDTWELGRNEVVGDIQGNRNVFIDYPEYAWLIFGREVPSGMTTPSGEAQANGHHWDNGTITTNATCTNSGVKTYKCTDAGCNETKTETILPLGHTWGTATVTTAPTCTGLGERTYKCTVTGCNGSKTETILANGHSYGDWITDKDPTETENGSKYQICATCGNKKTGVIPALGHTHNYSSVITPPTCTSKGYTTHSCSCGDSYEDTYVNMIPHSYQNGVCSICSATDPSAPTFTTEDFSNLITKLTSGVYSGKDRYIKICEALNIYNSFSEATKASVSGKYKALKNIVAQYNDEISILNNEAETLSTPASTSSAVSVSAIYFAAYYLLDKKYV